MIAATSLPHPVTGAMSPYPTVVIVLNRDESSIRDQYTKFHGERPAYTVDLHKYKPHRYRYGVKLTIVSVRSDKALRCFIPTKFAKKQQALRG